MSIVHELAAKDDIRGLQKLSDEDALKLNDKKQTGLHIATNYGNYRAVDYFIQNYPLMLAFPDENQCLPLHCNIIGRQEQVMEQLLSSYGEAIVWLNNWGRAPIHSAVALDKLHCVIQMLKYKPDAIYCRTSEKETLLHLATQRLNVTLVKYLLSVMPKELIVAQNNIGQTALHYAIYSLEIVALLLEADRSMAHCEDYSHFTPFLYAAERNDSNMVRLFLEMEPCVVKHRSSEGCSVLHLINDVEIAQMVLKIEPAEIYATDNDGHTVLLNSGEFNKAYARFLMHEKPSLLFVTNNNCQTQFEIAVYNQHKDLIVEMLKFAPELHYRDKNGNTTLHIAVKSMNKKAIALVFASRMSDLQCYNNNQDTPYHLAIQQDSQFATQLFKRHITVEMMISTCSFSEIPFFLQQCTDLSMRLLPELVAIIYSYFDFVL